MVLATLQDLARAPKFVWKVTKLRQKKYAQRIHSIDRDGALGWNENFQRQL